MTSVAQDRAVVENAIAFHRSVCPGLAVGVQAARLAVEELGEGPENLVAVVEADICAVDGVQAITGCTLGNRNLIMKDWGKNVYSFWRRSDGRAIRLSGHPAWSADYQALRRKVAEGRATAEEVARLDKQTESEARRILDTNPRDLFEVTEIHTPVPKTPTVDPWVTCSSCGEQVMETRTRRLAGTTVCIPCFEGIRVAS